MSRVLPNAIVAQAFNMVGIRNEFLETDLPPMVGLGLQKLYGFQHNDGGWGWWYDDITDVNQTAYVLFGLAMTKQAGFAVDEGVIERGAEALHSLLPDADPRAQAYAAYVLTMAGQPISVTVALTDALALDLFSQGALAIALDAAGSTELSASLVDNLSEVVIQDETTAHWAESDDHAAYSRMTMGSTVRTTAMVANALTHLDPENPLLPKAVRWLMSQRQGQGWGDTQKTSYAIMALTDYVLSTGELRGGAGYQVYVNGELWREGQLVQGDTGQTLTMTYTAGVVPGPTPAPSAGITFSFPITTGESITLSEPLTGSEAITTSVPITASVSESETVSESLTTTEAVTTGLPITTTEALTTAEGLTEPAVITEVESITVTASITTAEVVTVSETITEEQAITSGESITASAPITASGAVTELLNLPVAVTATQTITAEGAISPSLLQPGENQIEIVLIPPEGESAGRLYYAVTMRAAREPGADNIPAMQSGERSIGVRREYRPLGSTEPEELAEFHAGELVEVLLTLDVPEESWYVVVDDPLPAGFEAVNERLGTTSHVASAYQEPVYQWRDHGYNRKDVRDERVTLFITHLEPGQRSLSYLARAITAGEFVALPTEVYAMYEPEVWSRSDGARVRVAVR